MLIVNNNLQLFIFIFINCKLSICFLCRDKSIKFLGIFFSSATFSFFLAEKEKPPKSDIPETNSITETDEYVQPNNNGNPHKTSNLGCFLCAQLLTVTKQRVGLSQTQLRLVLNDKCSQLPQVFRVCYTEHYLKN